MAVLFKILYQIIYTLNVPLWFTEGMAEYQSLGWDIDTDMFIRDAAINEYLA